MELVYCHNCKAQTENVDVEQVQASNGLWRLAAKCKKCKTNKNKFFKKPVVVQKPKELTLADREIEVEELHRYARIIIPTRSIITIVIDNLCGADLVIMMKYKDENDGFAYILNVIDTF